jgi:hypothetical protein
LKKIEDELREIKQDNKELVASNTLNLDYVNEIMEKNNLLNN